MVPRFETPATIYAILCNAHSYEYYMYISMRIFQMYCARNFMQTWQHRPGVIVYALNHRNQYIV